MRPAYIRGIVIIAQADLAQSSPRLSLVGGPLHRLAHRIGLARASNATSFGFALGVLLWMGVVLLAVADGNVAGLFSLSRISGHVRLLLVIPLLFYAEALVDPQVGACLGTLERAGVIRRATHPSVDALVTRILRWNESWAPDTLCLAASIVLSLNAHYLPLVGATAAPDASLLAGAAGRTYVFWMISLAIFRFVILRWLLRLALWAYVLWTISRLELHLVATHPDGAGGLGYLEVVHSQFTPLVLALSIVQAAGLVEALSLGTTTITAVAPAIAAVAMVDIVLFIAPLFIFSPALWACRMKGLRDYMELASEYVNRFDAKWIEGGAAEREPLLGTSDLQSLADLNNSLTVVRNMRAFPASPRLFTWLGIAAAAPMLPLLLFKYPMADLVAKFFTQLTGL